MASFTERIAVVIDVSTQKATAGLKDFRTQVKDAEGFTGKLKAGVGSLKDTFMGAAASPAVLGAGIAAAGGFALKAVGDFSELGVEIGKFSDATGIAVEDASRWVEVAGDLGVESDSLQGILGKLNKNIDPALFKELGVQITYAKDGTVDANQTFLNVIDRLHGMKDPAERARTAAKLLGRGWQDVAEIVGMSTDDIKKRLEGVSDAKVFNKDEIKKARDFRDAQDALKDVFEDLVITVGTKLAPALTDAANSMSDIANDAKPAIDILGKASEVANKGTGFFTDLFDAVGDIPDVLSGSATEMTLFGQTIRIAGDETDDYSASARQATEYVDSLKDRVKATAKTMDEDAAATKRAKEATRDLRHAVEDLNEIQLDGISAKMDAFRADLALTEQEQRLNEVLGDTEASTSEQATAALDMAEAVADAAAKTEKLNGHTQTASERNGAMVMSLTAIRDGLAPNSPLRKYLDQYIADLLRIPANIVTRVSITGAGASHSNASSSAGTAGLGPDGEGPVGKGDKSTVINVNVRQMPTERELTDLVNNIRRRQGNVI